MSSKLFDYNKTIRIKNDMKKISNSVTCAKYSYVKIVKGKKVRCQYTSKLISNIDVPYKRYELQ